MKKILTAIIALCLSLMLCTAAFAAPDAMELLTASTAAMQGIQSMAVEMTMTMGIEGMMPTTEYMKLSIEMFNDPAKMKMTGKVMGMDMTMYSEQVDGQSVSYTNVMGMWSKSEGENAQADSMDPTAMLQVLDVAQEAQVAEATESVGGKDAYKITTVIDISKLASDSGLQSMVGGMMGGADMSQLQALLGDGEANINIVLYVDASTSEMLRMEMDMSDFLTKAMTAAAQQEDPSAEEIKGELVIAMDFKDINAVQDFEVPAEAKEASAA